MLNKLWHVHIMEHYAAAGNNWEALCVLIWKCLQDILLSGKKQSAEQFVLYISFCEKKKKKRCVHGGWVNKILFFCLFIVTSKHTKKFV